MMFYQVTWQYDNDIYYNLLTKSKEENKKTKL